ncbi:MAG: DUF2817 domain-containing protein [Betaproteobacteria bacterium]|jgi:hypothetical protein|nr:MAG: DUF2817 domain-containing protein [Betaproteobacteria bacterium]
MHAKQRMTGSDYFSKTYEIARSRFIAAACAAGGQMDEIYLDAMSPVGSPLAIEIAWFGLDNPSRVLIHSSGIHGVEGFAGSAVQLALLDSELKIPSDAALVLVHCLNPYGMAWLRRVNERNVDLNRNFVVDPAVRTGAADTYRRLDGLLNPDRLPAGRDLFYARALRSGLKYGMPALRQAVAEGQYEFPEGLFYGGKEFEKGARLYLAWLSHHLKTVRSVFAIDVHTGLGNWGQETLYLRSGADQTQEAAKLGDVLSQQVITDARAHGAYEIRGMLCEVFTMLAPEPEWSFLLQEFGTYSGLRVVNALREENYWYHHGNTSPQHRSRRQLKEMLVPANREWRDSVVDRGVSLCKRVMAHVFS